MNSTLKIKCPNCGAVLTVRNMEGIEAKRVTCPVCKMNHPFTEFKKPTVAAPKDDKTDYSDTELPMADSASSIGRLQDVETGRVYPLRLGTNSIGRKADSSSATVQIETEDKKMSRQHITIEVKQLSNGTYKHTLSNAQNKNATLVNGTKLESNDKVVLNGGESKTLARTKLHFC